MKEYHILNGDALDEQFPENIVGERIIARECLIVGPVQSIYGEQFYSERAKYLGESYGGSNEWYQKNVVNEFEKLSEIEDAAIVNLWFEDDLFCQANLWYTAYLLNGFTKGNFHTYIVIPEKHNRYGFAAYDLNGLMQLYKQRKRIDLEPFSKLWKAYASADNALLQKLNEKFSQVYPFLSPAIKAHLARLESETYKGRPKETLRQIMHELKTKDFAEIFEEFSKRESIYGFGDLQVKQLMDSMDEEEE